MRVPPGTKMDGGGTGVVEVGKDAGGFAAFVLDRGRDHGGVVGAGAAQGESARVAMQTSAGTRMPFSRNRSMACMAWSLYRQKRGIGRRAPAERQQLAGGGTGAPGLENPKSRGGKPASVRVWR